MANDTATNGGVVTQSAGWRPETPFLMDVPSGRALLPPTGSSTRAVAPALGYGSPFVAEYTMDGEQAAQTSLFAALVGELYDPEFDEAVEDLVDDAAAVAEGAGSFEVGDPVRQHAQKARVVRAYLEPLERAAEATLDRIEASLSGADVTGASGAALEVLLEQYAPALETMSPAFENFLKGLAKKALGTIGKVASTIGKVLPINVIIGQLKAAVRPLLDRVLKMALDKLPPPLRPAASRLARKFLGISEVGGASEADDTEGVAAEDPASIQEEFDTRLAGYVAFGDDFQRAMAAEETVDAQSATADPLGDLERGRHMFARRITELRQEEDPEPEIEHYVQAVLMALKLGIRILGRPRVVKTLAGFMARLIAKYVGREQSVALSRALVDAGLRLVNLEAAEPPGPLAAGYAIASTVENTVSRLVREAPDEVWDSEALLEMYTWDAFQEAAVAHFPDAMIRSDLHEASVQSGAWIALPVGTSAKRYEKYTRAPEVSITPQLAAAVKTFGGVTLRDFLQDRLGVTVDKPVQARVHLYQAIPGTRVSLIALHEKQVVGLGTHRREAWSLFHPLTPEAAGLLLNEPGLGKPVAPEALVRRGRLVVGQRLYYLEIPGARVRLARRSPSVGPRPAGSSHPHVTVDFPRRELRVSLVYSESHAQELAKKLRQRMPPAAILLALKGGLAPQFAHVLSGVSTKSLRVIHDAAPIHTPSSSPLAPIFAAAGSRIASALLQMVLTALRGELEKRFDGFATAFERAVKDEADGVTVVVTFKALPLLEHLRRLFGSKGLAAVPSLTAALARPAAGDYTLEVRAGVQVA
jgi:hypothetical protein